MLSVYVPRFCRNCFVSNPLPSQSSGQDMTATSPTGNVTPQSNESADKKPIHGKADVK